MDAIPKHDVFRVDGSRIRFRSLSFGPQDPYLIAREGDLFLIRVAAHKDWLELGRTQSYPSEWILFRAVPEASPADPGGPRDHFRAAETLDHREPGRKWRKCRDELLLRLGELARGGEKP